MILKAMLGGALVSGRLNHARLVGVGGGGERPDKRQPLALQVGDRT